MTLDEARNGSQELYEIAKKLKDAAEVAYVWLDTFEKPVNSTHLFVFNALHEALERAGSKVKTRVAKE